MIKMEIGYWGNIKIAEMSNEHLVHAKDKLKRNIQASYRTNPRCVHINKSNPNTWEYKLIELEEELRVRDEIIKQIRSLYSKTLS